MAGATVGMLTAVGALARYGIEAVLAGRPAPKSGPCHQGLVGQSPNDLFRAVRSHRERLNHAFGS